MDRNPRTSRGGRRGVRGLGLGLGLALAACNGSGDGDSGSAETEGSTDTDAAVTTSDGADETSTGAPPATVTYHGRVRAMVEQHCLPCHAPDNIAPFSMTSFEEVHALRESILYAVEAGIMPPWMPDSSCQDYLGDTSLTAEEIDAIRTWVDEGAVEGDPGQYVPPEVTPTGGLSRVDHTLTMPQAYLPQQSPDDYRCFLIDWPEPALSYVTGFSAVPDDLRTVHHMIAFAIRPDQVAEYEALDAADPEAGYTCFGGPGGEITDPTSAGAWLGAWAPGGNAGDFPEGTGIPMEPGSKVVLQVHYNTTVADLRADQSAVQFKVDAAVDNPAFMLLLANPDWLAGAMPIPAGAPSTVHSFEMDPTLYMSLLTDVIPPGVPFRIHSASHHMHTLGTAAQQTIERGDGSQTCLLELPRWDFNWQQQYRFAEPILFEPGDALRLACEWNNEAGDQTVNWGDGTSDEMCLGIYYITE